MAGIIYIILSFLAGYNLIRILFPVLFKPEQASLITDKVRLFPAWIVRIPASFVTGIMLFSTLTYFLAYAFKNSKNPMLFANVAVIPLMLLVALLPLIKNFSHYKNNFLEELKRTELPDILLCLTALIVSTFLMILTYRIIDNTLHMGMQIYGDGCLHTAIIRSFSKGLNFPAEYPFFPDGTMKYHFLFDFTAGNLEFLGLRIDWAFNIPSILSMWASVMLLYSLSVLITGKKSIGAVAYLLFLFRSSFAFITFIAKFGSIKEAIEGLLKNVDYIGTTPYEGWGIWTLNVFINQRHFSTSLALLLMSVILFMPYIARMSKEIAKYGFDLSWFLLEKDCWQMDDLKSSVFAGLLLGISSYWNGALLISAMSILFIMAVFSKNRLQYLNTAIITIITAVILSLLFSGTGGSPFDLSVHIGFVSLQKDIVGIILYYIKVLGILPLIVSIAFFTVRNSLKWLLLAFSAPFVLANIIKITPDIAVNHKYLNVSIILLNIFAAIIIVKLFSHRKYIVRFSSLLIAIVLTISGVADNIALLNKTNYVPSLKPSSDNPLTVWALNNSGGNEIFLTYPHKYIHPLSYAGRKIFYGMPGFAGSAGYDTIKRSQILKTIYNCSDVKTLKQLLEENSISYIVIEKCCLAQDAEFGISPEALQLIREYFKLVYNDIFTEIEIYRTY